MTTIDHLKLWVVTGSLKPSSDQHYKIDGYEVYIEIGKQKYKLTNKELEQFKIEEND